MKIDEDSFEKLLAEHPPCLFEVKVIDDRIIVLDKTQQVEGDLLFFGGDRFEAIEFAFDYQDVIGWLFFSDGENLEIIAKPDNALDTDEIFKKVFSSDGFETREEQLKIARFIEKLFKEARHGIIEAPTGTGKSIAYLVPAVLHAKRHSEKVVISTNTKNLQLQLFNKEIPFLKRFVEFKAEIAFGRNNYLCKRKVESIFSKGDMLLFDGDSFSYIKDFYKTTTTGLKSEFFSQYNIDESLWRLVESSTLSCAHSKCPHYKKDCFFYKVKDRLERADIIVSNHHLVLSDSVLEHAEILPEYSCLVFDEAHNIEKNATNYYTNSTTTSEILRLLDMLYKKGLKTESGLLANFDGIEELKNLIVEQKNLIESIVETFLKGFKKREAIALEVEGLTDFAKELSNCIGKVINSLNNFIKDRDSSEIVDIKGVFLLLSNIRDIIESFLVFDNRDAVLWIEKSGGVKFNITPVDVKKPLNDFLLDKLNSVVFISATLSVADSFDFFKNVVGLDNADCYIAHSNFNYQDNSVLLVVDDLHEPKDEEFDIDVAEALKDIAKALETNKRGVLVLFTSYRMLNNVFESVADFIQSKGFDILRQGELDNFELLNRFKKGGCFLFATNSFWEGIDVKGDALSVVVITKLPFEVPTSPIQRFRYEKLKKEGVNAFYEYSLPKAVLRLKQGLGRLIRSKDDRGVMVVLDRRIFSKSYGRVFVESLSYMNIKRIKSSEIESSIVDFFDSSVS
ncbi:ATP-dependent DNA helicase [Hippea jasoniae]|uniref:ATP-dependent DNA helicase n=1 Tax=Hippea jasoniae TaxID=944479 RepID=UPI0005505CF5|nr:ATP-dependent DNA helicase [Hippea jasoniae]